MAEATAGGLIARADRVARGIGLYLVAILILSVMDAAIKWVSVGYPTTEVVFFRALFGLVPLVLVLSWRRDWGALRTTNVRPLLLRGVVTTATGLFFFYAFKVMPLADAYAIAFASPLFITAMSVPLLGEHVGIRRWSAVAVGFAGVLIMLRPGTAGLDDFLTIGAAAALAGTFCYALGAVLIRKLTAGETNAAVIFYGSIVQLGATAAMLPFGFVVPDGPDLALMAAIGLLGGVGAFALTEAFRSAPVAILAPFEYTAMIWAVIFGWWLWQELPDLWIISGSVIVVASGLYILHRETRKVRVAA